MKRSMKWLGRVLVVVAVGVFAIGSAWAGYKRSENVVVAATYFYGSMGTARNSPDNNQQIGCRVDGAPNYNVTVCWAADSANMYRSCYTTDPSIFKAAQGITGDSYLSLDFDSSGICTYLLVTRSSIWAPK